MGSLVRHLPSWPGAISDAGFELRHAGTWVSARNVPLGAGVLAVVDSEHCPIAETARIVTYLAGESAKQCGPCVNALPAIADALTALTSRRRALPRVELLQRRSQELVAVARAAIPTAPRCSSRACSASSNLRSGCTCATVHAERVAHQHSCPSHHHAEGGDDPVGDQPHRLSGLRRLRRTLAGEVRLTSGDIRSWNAGSWASNSSNTLGVPLRSVQPWLCARG